MTAPETVFRLVTAASEFLGIPATTLIGPHRSVDAVEGRLACYIALRARGWTFQRIGSAFRRDHTSIIKALGSAGDNRGPRDATFRELCRHVEQALTDLNP